MTAKSAAYLWYPRDFAADEHVVLMDLQTEGAYRRLLDHQWLHGSIPSDIPSLAKICKGIHPATMQRLWPGLSPCFRAYEIDGRLVNEKMERVRVAWDAHRAKKVEAGRRGGLSTQSKGRGESSTTSSDAQAELKPSTPTPMPITEAPPPPARESCADMFTDPQHRDAYLGHRTAAQHPAMLDGEIRALLSGMRGPVYAPEDVGQALVDLLMKGTKPSSLTLSRFAQIAREVRERPPPSRQGSVDGLSMDRVRELEARIKQREEGARAASGRG